MFNRTRYRLVLLFTIVFLLLFYALGAILYATTANRLYAQIDRTLESEMNGLAFFVSRQPSRSIPFRPMQLMTFLQWDTEGSLRSQAPREGLGEPFLETMKQAGAEGVAVTVKIEDTEYRLLTRTVPNGKLQIAYHLEPERNVLKNLLLVIGAGSIVSIAIAALAGLFLADRAFIPIRKAWEQQQQFVSDASHELRTPLSIIQIHLERLFRHPDRTIAEESQKIAVMIGETKRMTKLVGDLLTLARSDSVQFELQHAAVSLPALAVKVAGEFEELCAGKQIRIETDAVGGESTVAGDPDYLYQLLLILIDNAVKYTKEGSIQIRTGAEGGQALIRISDTGIGIDAADLPHIFNRFYRADKARSRKDGGAGLGLSIAKWIVDVHQGTIRVESEPGQGTQVYVSLPMEGYVKGRAKRRRLF